MTNVKSSLNPKLLYAVLRLIERTTATNSAWGRQGATGPRGERRHGGRIGAAHNGKSRSSSGWPERTLKASSLPISAASSPLNARESGMSGSVPLPAGRLSASSSMALPSVNSPAAGAERRQCA